MLLCELYRQPDYVFVTDCVSSSNGDAISDMVDIARAISYRTFLRHVGRTALAELFPGYDWSLRPRYLTLQGDYHVNYYRSKWHGVNCVFLLHSAIEYIFVRRDQLRLLHDKKI